MQNKKFKRLGAALLAAALVLPSFSGMSVEAASDTQMSSEEEVVYVNMYTDTETREQDFDSNWKFYLGDASGAENAAFDDSAWRTVSVPHDYSIEQEYSKQMEAESGYLPGGTGWYRKHFAVGSALEGKELRLDFGGVYMDATFWLNGEKLGEHPYGYTPFSFDITDYVNYGEENVLTVKVNHRTPSSRFYSGSGIYRSVYLTVMDPVHVDLYGTKVETPNLEAEAGGNVKVTVDTTVANEGADAANVVLVHTMYEKGTENSIGTVTTNAVSVAAGETKEIAAELTAQNPELWGLDDPNLYTVVTEVKVGNDVVDTYETEFGFRYFEFDNNTGFTLNGEKVKLQGVCMHHDQGSLGAEMYASAVYRQMKIMKEMGCNAIRVTHNPASDELIEACNELGLLVIDEAFDGWLDVKNGNTYDYSNWIDQEIGEGNEILGGEADMTWGEFDIKAMVNRGKNSPAVIMWSLGNEVQEGTYWESTNQFPQFVSSLIEWVEEIDTTRPVTNGDNALQNLSTQAMLQVDANIHAAGGVVGTNYSNNTEYDNIHNRYPEWNIYGSETASHVNSRGVYNVIGSQALNSDKGLTAYDYSCVGWGATASSGWYDVITRDFVAGEFVWTGFDYLGEPTPRNGVSSGAQGAWPSPKNSYFGIVDTAGLPKDNYYFYHSQWNHNENTLHVLPAWNENVIYKNGQGKVPVVVYSDAAAVELFITGTDGVRESLGKKEYTEKTTAAGFKYQMYEGSGKESTTDRNLYMTWYVPYEDGKIEAVAYDKSGNVITDTVGRSFVETAGAAAKLDATVDRETIAADGKDLAYITVDVKDADGTIVPDAANNVKFIVEGDGVLVGVDNGKQADHQSYQDDNRNAYNGSLVAIVQSTKEAGSFTVTAVSDGLTSDSVTVTTEGSEGSAGVSFVMSKNYYVKVGNAPELPTEIETRVGDNAEMLTVEWEAIDAADYAQAGTFTVNGIVGGEYSASVTINMIDEIGGILNYSTTTPLNVAPTLPASRPLVLADGTVENVAFPVTWENTSDDAFAEAGIVVVEGTANVFGTEYAVAASVRVQEEELTLGDSISYQALTLTEDIAEDLTSDTLDAIKDGSLVKDANTEGGRNTSAWSNYNSAQAGDNTSVIEFSYATQQRFGEIVIHFWEDGYSAAFPDAGTTVIEYSENGTEWTELEATETIGEAKDSIKAYTYTFDPFLATFVRFTLTDGTAQKTVTPCTGIVEIELKKMEASASVTYATAELAALTIDGVEATEGELASGVFYTEDLDPVVTAEGADNAAVTVVPKHDDKILVIVESENHLVRNTYTVILGQERPADPSDASADYPVSDLTAISDSEYLPGTSNEGPDDFILDGDASTHWHTNWATSEAQSVDKRWVGVSLKEATSIDSIRFLPRSGNGAVTEYKIQYRATDDGEWIDVATGTWAQNDYEWKLVTFDAVVAKQVRIVGVHTWADSGNDAHMSAAEFRVRVAKEQCTHEAGTELANDKEPTCTEDGYTGNQVCKDCGKVIEKGEKIDKLGHDWSDWTVVKEATEDEEGLKERSCSRCDKKDSEVLPKKDTVPVVNPFEDVSEADYFYNAVIWAVENNVTTGDTATLFAPYKECNRAQIVLFLYRALNGEAVDGANPFTDVSEADYCYDAVLWAVENGITNGITATTFEPWKACTRAEIVTFLWRAMGSEEVAADEAFVDVNAADFFYDAVIWAVENGVTTGLNDTTFGAWKNCYRGDAVTFIQRAVAK